MAELNLGAHLDDTAARSNVPAVVRTDDLVTHGVVVGMTGSGKTGLGVVLVEECLDADVPALLFDPKGDLTNLCLIFPELSGQAFAPWVDPAAAAKAGMSPEQYATEQAHTWRDGLASWQVPAQRLAGLRQSVDFTVYTPGSSAGTPLNILGSLQAPTSGVDEESRRDEISSYASSLLGLLGIEADPLTSREHILLSTLIEHAWERGESLDLPALVAAVNQPPFRKLGVFDLEHVFPEDARMQFALRLNGLLAAPGFAAWLEGEAIDVERLLRTPDGRPRCAVITTAHLSDAERQSVTALVLSKLVSWMRAQSGATDLRALVYLDEVAGYIPPVSNPPTKQPLLLLMKQARAFGVGVVLCTQNPVDIDYKALSNAGTWMIGRLQTEQDKARLLDGLTSVVGDTDRAGLADAIAGLRSREFLLRRPDNAQPSVLTTRWAMSYLRGPLTRDQIAHLKAQSYLSPRSGAAPPDLSAADPDASPEVSSRSGEPVADVAADETPVMPPVASGIPVGYLDPSAPWARVVDAHADGTRWEAAAAARVHLLYDERRADLMHEQVFEAILYPLTSDGSLDGLTTADYDDRDFNATGPAAALYVLPDADVESKQWWRSLSSRLRDQLVRQETLVIYANRELRLYSRPEETREEFLHRCTAAADDAADEAVAALRRKAETKVRSLQSRMTSAQAQAARAEANRNAQIGTDVAATVGGLLGGVFGGRRSRRSVASAARRARTAQDRLARAQEKVDDVAGQLAELEADLADEIVALDEDWESKAEQIDEVEVGLERNDVRVDDLRLVWVPRRS